MRSETSAVKRLLKSYCPLIPVHFQYAATKNCVDSSDILHIYISGGENERATVAQVIRAHSRGLTVYNENQLASASGFFEPFINDGQGSIFKVHSLLEFICLHLVESEAIT